MRGQARLGQFLGQALLLNNSASDLQLKVCIFPFICVIWPIKCVHPIYKSCAADLQYVVHPTYNMLCIRPAKVVHLTYKCSASDLQKLCIRLTNVVHPTN